MVAVSGVSSRQRRPLKMEAVSPGNLILLLYEGAIRFSQEAKESLDRGDLEGKRQYIQKARDAVFELQKSLDLETGGDIASALDKLYSFVLVQLNEADRSNDYRPLDMVTTILNRLEDAWSQIIENPAAVA
ncbi:MAG: flagellar export chaperone FliS [Candidatus Latescibacterota bacterium]|nr:MAG: flagellar export chaperone FliS [Candidatus Latescibacterota bacterium]